MNDNITYNERISSLRTTLLFLVLTLIFLLLFVWRFNAAQMDFLAGFLLAFSIIFLFYVVNYYTLLIRITKKSLKLTFGIFHMTIPLENVAASRLDKIPTFMKYGGAGIHFMMIDQRYRASFNFLEYPRVVVALKHKRGPVRDVSFSTRQPDTVLSLIQQQRA